MSAPRVGIVDYHMGNLRSVEWALADRGASVSWIHGPHELEGLDLVVLPGVGHFGRGMQELQAMNLVEHLRRWIERGRAMLGICLGFQLLFESSEEAPGVAGLGVLRGEVTRLPETDADGARLKVPQMGWNEATADGDAGPLAPLAGRYYYFVHSFAAPAALGVPHLTTTYGRTFASAAAVGNVWGAQFHPERSGRDGLQFLDAVLGAVAA